MSFEGVFSIDSFVKYEATTWGNDDRDLMREMLLAQPMHTRCWRCDVTLHTGPAKEDIRVFKQHLLEVHGETWKRKKKTQNVFEMSPMDHKDSVRRGQEASAQNKKWTKEALYLWLHEFRKENGRNPVSKDKGIPDDKAVKREIGSWKVFARTPDEIVNTYVPSSKEAA